MEHYERIIIGAGLYGLYAALHCARQGRNVLVLECDPAPFTRATYANQARVHQGYHYPRSLSTARKSAGYFERFHRDFSFCINSQFDQVYATSTHESWTDADEFERFCRAADIPCERLHPDRYFREGMCDGAFLTKEYTYDAVMLRDYYLDRLTPYGTQVEQRYGIRIISIDRGPDFYTIRTEDGGEFRSEFVLNASYASANQILRLAGFESFQIKYELCEIILCEAVERLQAIGITVMDGPFFSIMPFGKTGLHSLTAVSFTPHMTSYEEVPGFPCQIRSSGHCSAERLGNCSTCPARPASAWPYMSALAHKYLREEFGFRYRSSLFSMKPILMSSEIDDSRPTVIRVSSERPAFVSVLSGKINTVYDLDEVLDADPASMAR